MTAFPASVGADSRTLHIRCGSDIQGRLTKAGFAGDLLEHSYPCCQPVSDGRAVRRGERDGRSLGMPDRWVGGVRIATDAPDWRWDDAAQRPVKP